MMAKMSRQRVFKGDLAFVYNSSTNILDTILSLIARDETQNSNLITHIISVLALLTCVAAMSSIYR